MTCFRINLNQSLPHLGYDMLPEAEAFVQMMTNTNWAPPGTA